MAKVWLQERWQELDAALEGLTIHQSEEIARICNEEIEYWKSRDISQSALRNPMTATRKHLREHFTNLTNENSWINNKGEKEHISLKYMNFSIEQWAEMNAPSKEKQEARLQDRKPLNDPDAIVTKAAQLLSSSNWQDVTVGLAALTGRRLNELLLSGEFTPRTRYSLTFKGQLKTRDKVMAPYEIPTLIESTLVLTAINHLRRLVDGSTVDEHGLGEIADRHFSDLVPARTGGSLYTHLFRAVYGCIAVFYFCPPEVLDTKYMNRIYGHYWISKSDGELQANYNTTQHYQDYYIGDAAILKHEGKRQGVKLGAPGVEILEVFKPKEVTETNKRGAKMAKKKAEQIRPASQTGFSSARPKQNTRTMLDQIMLETNSRIDDDVLKLLCTEHYALKTLASFGAALEEIAALLTDAANDSETPVQYLADMLKQKREFKKSYETRHHGKDYSTMKTSDLLKHKAPEAAAERFRRAVDAIMAYNDSVELPELRWYINAAVICDLVGGAPTGAKAYLATRPDVVEHHSKHKLSPGFNRRGVSINERVNVPE